MGRTNQTRKDTRYGALVDNRRAKVTELLVKGNTPSQIWEEMVADEDCRNAAGKPWHVQTLAKDIKFVRKQWQQIAQLHYDVHISRLMGQIRAVRKAAWADHELPIVLKTLEQEIKLLGLDKASKTDIDWKEALRNRGINPTETFEDLVQSTYERMVLAGEVPVE
jgi:hypothetical protein